jgi:hypothetical protein
MSEAFDLPKPMITNAALGAASPLWGYFAGAAMSGVAFWWAMKAAQPATYQALAARLPAPAPALPEAAVEAEVPFVPTAAAVSSEPSAVVEAVAEPEPEPTPPPAANDLTTDARSA